MAGLGLVVLLAGPVPAGWSDAGPGPAAGSFGAAPRVPADSGPPTTPAAAPVRPPSDAGAIGPQPIVAVGSTFVIGAGPGTAVDPAGEPVAFGPSDVLVVDPDGAVQRYIDGADLGLGPADRFDAVAVLADGTVLLSTATAVILPGPGPVRPADVIALTPTSLGDTTAGRLTHRFVGAGHGLDDRAGNVDAVAVDRDGRLLLSTTGVVITDDGPVFGADVVAVSDGQLRRYLDGASVGLDGLTENVVGIAVHESGAIHLATEGRHRVADRPDAPVLAGRSTSVLQCLPMTAAPTRSCLWSHLDDLAPVVGFDGIGGLSSTTMVGYFNDFASPLGPDWIVYDSIGHAGWGLRRPSAVEVRPPDRLGPDGEPGRGPDIGGLLTITAAMGVGEEAGLVVSGGAKLRFPQTYGRYTVRVRVEPDPDDVTSGVVLLWPESNQHPRDGEIDILESWRDRRTRSPVESNLHWLRPGAQPPYDLSDDEKTGLSHPGTDGTTWHVFDLEWREDLISVAVDGGPPMVLSTDPARIADWNMEPTVQLDSFDARHRPGQQPVLTGSVTMFVDFLAIRP